MKKKFIVYYLDSHNSLVHLCDSEGENIAVPFHFEPQQLKVGEIVEVAFKGEQITHLKPLTLDSLMVQSYILYQPDFVHPSEKSYFTVTLERRSQRDGPDRWGIFKNNSVLSKSFKNFGYESMPSNRTDESLADTRFTTASDAFIFWKQLAEPMYGELLRPKGRSFFCM